MGGATLTTSTASRCWAILRAVRLLPVMLLLAVSTADARVRWTTPGSYRFRSITLGDVALDPEGTVTGKRIWGEHRLRIDPTIEVGPVEVHIQVDVLTGQTFGDTHSVGDAFVARRYGDPERRFDGWTTVEPRMAWVEMDLEWLQVEAGQLGAHWGMGLLEHDGNDRVGVAGVAPSTDVWVAPLADLRSGDIYQRLRVATTPFAALSHADWADLVFALGADHVWQDADASFLDDDSAVRLFGSLFYPGERLFVGLHTVHRAQTDRDGDTLSVTAFDAYGRFEAPLYLLRARMRLQGEALLRVGDTDRHRPGGRAAGVDLLQLGWAARGEIAWRCPRLALGLEGGYASGDADPDDGDKRDLTFDPDHRVGFILFPDVLRLVTLRGAERVGDPTRVGVPEAGAEQLPTDGAVRNAVYVAPAATWRPGAWRLGLHSLFAWAAEPFVDPFETFAAGGSGRNHRGGAAESFYGFEVAGEITYSLFIDRVGHAGVGVVAGMFVPGGALGEALFEDPVVKGVARLDLRW